MVCLINIAQNNVLELRINDAMALRLTHSTPATQAICVITTIILGIALCNYF